MSDRYIQVYGGIFDTKKGENGAIIASVEAIRCTREMRDKIAKYAIEKLNSEEEEKSQHSPLCAVNSFSGRVNKCDCGLES